HARLRRGIDLSFEHLEVETQARERRAQVVRDTCEERGALARRGAQVFLHLVEGPGEGADLRGPALGDRWRIAAAAQRARGARELVERTVDAPHDDERGEDRDREPRDRPRYHRGEGIALDAAAR